MNFLKDYIRFMVGNNIFYLPTTGCDVYKTDKGYDFDMPSGSSLIFNNEKFEGGLVMLNYDAETNKIESIVGTKGVDVGTELVELFIAQTPTLRHEIKDFLLQNPRYLDDISNSPIPCPNPHTWTNLSIRLDNLEKREEEITEERLERTICMFIGCNIISEKFLEFLRDKKKTKKWWPFK